jgi:isopentenyl phosphate kinase
MPFVMYLIKFGGSVITEKSKKDAIFKDSLMGQLAESLIKAKREYIIVHGAGSFGHVLAKEYDLNSGFKTDEQRIGFSLTQTKVQELNTLVLQAFQNKGLAAVSLPPHGMLILDNHKKKEFQKFFFEIYLSKGFTPVTYGDVVLDYSLGFSICSGDLLMVALTEVFKPEKVIFIMDEDGLYNENPKIYPNAEFIDRISSKQLHLLSTKLDNHPDVTGGMRGKIDTIYQILKYNIDVVLLNGNKPGRLYDVLVGNDTISTFIYG